MAESIPQEREDRFYVRKGRKGSILRPSPPSSSEEEEEEEEAKRQKTNRDALLEKIHPLAEPKPTKEEEKKREKAAPPEEEDWERIYSYEEKTVKAYLDRDRQRCINWEKKNRSWEIQKGLIPSFEEEEMMQKPLILVCGKQEEGREEAKRKKTAPPEDWEKEYSYEEMMLKARLDKQGYGEWEKKHRLWEILNYLVPVAEVIRRRSRGNMRFGLQYLRDNAHPAPVFSWEEEREKFAPQAKAEGRCLDGSYLIPYCKCNKQSYHFDRTEMEDYPPECLPIWLAYCRQLTQSHVFDIDNFLCGRIAPLELMEGLGDMTEILLGLANHVIEDYNEKEYNVFNYKVLKIEKVNCSPTNAYYMTVKVLNLTFDTTIETFQIHAGTHYADTGKIIYCCRPKEEPIIGLPSCEFCFDLLPEGRVTGEQEP
ncbi:hypothetical protein P3S68_033264 [Capsicum galapagoense]